MTSEQRSEVIEKWRNDEIDIMVATSAFGLGMDKSDVRLVLHACVPENLDRFYQEVGRGGRDGKNSSSLLIWNNDDKGTAKRMSSGEELSDDNALERWNTLWERKSKEGLQDDDGYIINVEKAIPRGLNQINVTIPIGI